MRAADSVGANIAESYGRYHFAERVQFFYYARGSAFETVYWLKRAGKRNLLDEETVNKAVAAYSELIALLNGIIKATNQKRNPARRSGRAIGRIAETGALYLIDEENEESHPF